ncbi:hypothetical protein SDC9_129419 [bioreactor metagenome]|uniref:Uncharacterized protein n=1 Tax=bioreactor metagenome TaxID=1076179 RepID=A0A645CZS7_9ZZZZ
MKQEPAHQVARDLENAIKDAKQVLDAAREARAQSDMSSEEMRQRIEQQLSSQDIADVTAEVDACIARIHSEARAQTAPAKSTTAQARRARRMI